MDGQPTTVMNFDPASPVMLAMVGVIGLGLCLCGRKLARPVTAIGGLALGGLIVYLLPKASMDRTMLLLWVAGGCLVGVVIAFVLFRIMMGLLFAIVLMTLLPTVALLSQDQMPTIQLPAPADLIVEPTPVESGADADQPPPIEQRIQRAIEQMVKEQLSAVNDWWLQLGRTGQYTVTFCAGAGALFGLVIGIIGPYFTASILAALAGATMLLASALAADVAALDTHLPPSPLGRIAVVCLITTVGVAIQWTNFRKKTDKS